MTLCFFIDSLFHGAGTERISVDVANALVEEGYKINFVLLNTNINSFFKLNPEISIYTINTSFSQKMKSIFRFRRWLKENKPDVVINVSFQMSIISLLACIDDRAKIITWEHFFLKSSSVLSYLMRFISVLMGYKLVVLTEEDRKSYPGFLRNKICCISNFTTMNVQGKITMLDSKIVLTIGRLNLMKGFDLLIESWRIVSKEYPDWKLKIVGEGDDRERLEDLIVRYALSNSVEILCPTKNILSLYLDASLYVLPSRYEPFGLVMIEAKSCGLPIVAFDCLFGPKNIIRDHIDGLLVKAEDIQGLSYSICSLIGNHKELEDMSKNAILDYESRWSKKVVITEWKKLFLSC